MSAKEPSLLTFRDLQLPAALMAAVDEVGYETPSAIQAQAIPILLGGNDLIGRAPTGTGKTAAFALPLLARIDLSSKDVQLMVLTPTRELAIQVAEAFQRYASHMEGFHVLPIYGGQDYSGQIRSLNRGVHAVVGTPGRVMDHMKKGRLKLDNIKALVLDEADEMLRMGFIDDVEWILEQTNQKRQTALFSATMPAQIKRIAQKYLTNPSEVAIQTKASADDLIRQRYWKVSGLHKLDALTRILETEEFDAMLIFARTKIETVRLAEKLEARGHAASALNGDLPQKQRESIINRLKKGQLDILIATDVAARGLDVERITHVLNYDIPSDTESYIHRIGRTGRAGRKGEAILFVSPRERRMFMAIEKATGQQIEPLVLPTIEMVHDKRVADFKQAISDTIASSDLNFMRNVVEEYQREHDIPELEIAAALAKMVVGDKEVLMGPAEKAPTEASVRKNGLGRAIEIGDGGERRERTERAARPERSERPERGERPERFDRQQGNEPPSRPTHKPRKSKNQLTKDKKKGTRKYTGVGSQPGPKKNSRKNRKRGNA
ncbi:MAG: DEAD/DEAH box helicase [Bacteroidetes bacterium]|nr:DEAD/DEAH box helicase [Bacteroidota bacterium]MDA0873698.1 DEAD/DEAH box helicase [Bacteroidota bacterium]